MIYSQMGIQMGITIAGFAYLGYKLDEWYNPGGQGYTVALSLLGVGIGLYLPLKRVIKMSQENEEK